MSISRRNLLLAGGAAFLSSAMFREALAKGDQPIYGGWIDDPAARRTFIETHEKPLLRNHDTNIFGSSEGKSVLLLPYYEKVTGRKFKPYFQDIGDCCGQAGTTAAQVLAATQIVKTGREQWKGEFSVEYTYAASRVEVGGGKIRRGDGSTGSWTAEALHKYGVLLRGKYGKLDLTKYRPDLGKSWGKSGVGVPDELEKIAKLHPVKTISKVESWDQAADCVANGYPVLLCSSVGYRQTTDSEGFLRRSGTWNHALFLAGIDRRKGKREGGLIPNSWGENWVSGPAHELGTPAGCFWADAKNINAMIEEGDCYAFSNYVGYPSQKLDYRLF